MKKENTFENLDLVELNQLELMDLLGGGIFSIIGGVLHDVFCPSHGYANTIERGDIYSSHPRTFY